jgi:Do/DeqQ family serine protease
MMRRFSAVRKFVVALGLCAAFTSGVLWSDQQSWKDKLFPKKEPAKQTVEPAAGVLKLEETFANVVEKVKPAVVNISAVQITRVQEDPHQFYYGDPNDFLYRYFNGEEPPARVRPREQRMEGTGSGVIINPEGYILTNNHVVQDADELSVTLSNEKTYKGKVVGTDPRTDLAIIKIKAPADLPYVSLGDSSAMRVGDFVLALGSPFGLQQTVTSGIVSAIRQSLDIEGKSFRNLIQTDAAINRGNSGGALVNIRGELIGINTAIYAPTGVFSGIGFAIPINDAKSVMKDLIEKGFVERSWMGVEVAPIDEVIKEQFGLPSTDGALVNSVVPGAPAAKAGIQRGDVIMSFDGKSITTVQSLQDTVTSTPPGRTVPVKVSRGRQALTLSLKTEKLSNKSDDAEDDGEGDDDRSKKQNADGTVEWLGATFATLTPRLANKYEINDSNTTGVVAVDIPEKSIAADAGLNEGDVIRAVNRIPIASANGLAKAKRDVDPKKGVVLDVVREGHSFYLSYKSLQ